MIGYVMVGTKNLACTVSFYDALMPRMGMTRVECNEDHAAFAPQSTPQKIEFYDGPAQKITAFDLPELMYK